MKEIYRHQGDQYTDILLQSDTGYYLLWWMNSDHITRVTLEVGKGYSFREDGTIRIEEPRMIQKQFQTNHEDVWRYPQIVIAEKLL